MDITLTVLPEHKIGAHMFSVYDCPMARCIKDQLNTDKVVVGVLTASIDGRHYNLGLEVMEWIMQAFEDLDSAPVPFTFTMTEVE